MSVSRRARFPAPRGPGRALPGGRTAHRLAHRAQLGGLAGGAREQDTLDQLAIEKKSALAYADAGNLASLSGSAQVRGADPERRGQRRHRN